MNEAYTIFGKIIDGFDTLDKMEEVPIDSKHKPLNEIMIEKVTIHANPIADNEG